MNSNGKPKKLSFRTEQTQEYHDVGTGKTELLRYMGNCIGCGSKVYSRTAGDDPRGIVPPQHTYYPFVARDHDMLGVDVPACFDCCNDSERYHRALAWAKEKWITPPIKSILIAGRRWFRRTAGHTYYTAEIFVDGVLVKKLGPDGGYGNHYEWEGFRWLAEHGFLPLKRHASGSIENGAIYCRENGIAYATTVVDVTRERDL